MKWGFFLLQQGLRVLLGGTLLVAAPLALLTAWGRRQWLHEWQNSGTARPKGNPWIAFEVSSEGELEQVRPLLEYFVAQIKQYNVQSTHPRYLELVFASPSVEKKALACGAQFKEEVFVARLPLLSWGWKWLGRQNLAVALQAPNIFFCRYDFYPHLLTWAMQKNHRAFLLSATLKNKLNGRGSRWYAQQLMHIFQHVVFATDEAERWKTIGLKDDAVTVYDFRHGQIGQRLAHAESTLNDKAFYGPFREYLATWPRENRVIMGSAWPPEIAALKNTAAQEALQNKAWQLTIAPHQLKPAAVQELASLAEKMSGIKPVIITPDLKQEEVRRLLENRPSMILLTVPGILCELYRDFGHAVVGGGFGRSVHSLLEPYWANGMIYCGPKVFRSTEYDFVVQNSPRWIKLLTDASDFYPSYLATSSAFSLWPQEKEARHQKQQAAQEKFLLLANNLLQSLQAPTA